MKLEIIKDRELDTLKAAWHVLQSGKDMTVFQSYEWHLELNQLYRKEHTKNLFRELVYLYVTQNGKPVMIAPLVIVKAGMKVHGIGVRRGAYLVGGNGYTDYMNFVYDTFSPEAAEMVMKCLTEQFKIHYCLFEQLPETTGLNRFLQERYPCNHKDIFCAKLQLPETADQYQKMLSKNSRQNIRTALNRQARDELEISFELLDSVDETLARKLLDIRAKRMKGKKQKEREGASAAGKAVWYARLLKNKLFSAKHDVMHCGLPQWCFLVKHREEIIGFYWGILDGRNTMYVILAGVEPEYAWYSPSVSQFYLFLRAECENHERGIRAVDFTRGDEKYKLQLGAEPQFIWNVEFRI